MCPASGAFFVLILFGLCFYFYALIFLFGFVFVVIQR